MFLDGIKAEKKRNLKMGERNPIRVEIVSVALLLMMSICQFRK